MSTDFSIRPVGTPAAPPVVQPSNQAVSNAVQTDLPPSQSVTAADSSVLVRNEAQEQAQNQFFLSHQAYYDRTAASMVYQIVNRKTSEVVEQYPDEAVLRRRAYFHSLDMQKDIQREETPQVHPTDRTA
jgi:predicted exporter